MHGGHTKCIVATQNTRHFLLESFVWEEAIHVPFLNRGVSYDWDLSVVSLVYSSYDSDTTYTTVTSATVQYRVALLESTGKFS